MTSVLAILQLIMGAVPQLVAIGQQAIAAHNAGDQATLDALLVQAEGVANALAPPSTTAP